MESANFHHHQQLQDDQLVDSPPLSSPSCYGAATTLSWPQNTNICLSTRDTFNPNIDNYGAIVNSRDPNSPMIQDLGFHWTNCTNSTAGGSFTGCNRSPHDLQLERIKEEFSETYPKLTEMISSPTSSIEDLHLHPSSYIKNNQQQRDPHNLSANMRSTISNDKLLVRNFSSGCKINGLNQLPGGEFMIYPNSTNPQNCSGRGTFSQIFPTVNISDLNQSSNLPISSSSLDINLPALNLFRSARFNGSFIHPSSTDNSHLDGIFKDSTTSIPYGLDHMQQISHRPTNSPSKISASFNSGGGAEAKRPSNYMEETKAPQSTATKKSRLESRSSCPPFKVRKEKLGDRISALQQLVAPFGKTSNGQLPRLSPGTIMNTVQLRCEQDCQERIDRYITQILQTDTASVLMEAIGYIKFLQNQVETLSVPYMKSSHTKTGRMIHLGSMEDGKEEPKRDLRSRGLCLVPLPCLTYVTDGSGGVWSPPNFTN